MTKATASRRRARSRDRRGFTLLELMVSMSVLSILMLLVFDMFGQTQKAWSAARSRVATFKEARTAFESLTRSLSQATLNAYTDYNRPYGGGAATGYQRQSDMHFVSGRSQTLIPNGTGPRPTHCIFYQSPIGFATDPRYLQETLGMQDLLNSCGYFVEFASNEKYLPQFLRQRLIDRNETRERYRLMEFRPPSKYMEVYRYDLKNPSNKGRAHDWYKEEVNRGGENATYFSRPIAENIVALIVEPRESSGSGSTSNTLAPSYAYDSQGTNAKTKHKLPPIVDVTMVAVDEASILKYEQVTDGNMESLIPPGLFTSSSSYEADLLTIKRNLADANIDFRIFKESVTIRSSRWEDE